MQSPVAFEYRLMNEHYAKQLLSHFKLLEKCVEEKDEYMEAFTDLNKFIEKELRSNEDYEYTEAKQNMDDEQDYSDIYRSYYSTLDSFGTSGSFALKSISTSSPMRNLFARKSSTNSVTSHSTKKNCFKPHLRTSLLSRLSTTLTSTKSSQSKNWKESRKRKI